MRQLTKRAPVDRSGALTSHAEGLVNNFLLSDPFIPYTSVIGSIIVCKMVYDLSHMISNFYFRSYAGLTKIQRIEWNNRGLSTIHAIYITIMALYFVFWSDLFSDHHGADLITLRSTPLSTLTLGASVGYFLTDLGMICWLYPSLGGMEYIVHHSISGIAVAYSMFTGEGQLYTFMILISEATTPEINMRWYLDIAGLKNTPAYLLNGVVMFSAWSVARILLFGYTFYHVRKHYDEVIKMHAFGILLVFVVPVALATMNLIWFGKIVKGLVKTLVKTMDAADERGERDQ